MLPSTFIILSTNFPFDWSGLYVQAHSTESNCEVHHFRVAFSFFLFCLNAGGMLNWYYTGAISIVFEPAVFFQVFTSVSGFSM